MNARQETLRTSALHTLVLLAIVPATLVVGSSAYADDYTQYLKQGNQLYAEGKFVEAEESYIQAMNDKPDSAAGFFNIGNTFFAREDFTRAIENFQSALVHARADRALETRARYNLATARVKESERSIGDFTDQEKLKTGVEFLQQAISDYRDVLEIDPDHQDARHNLAIARLRIKNLFDTLKKLQEEAAKNKEKGQSPVEILKELIKEEEGEIALTQQALENATQASKLDEQKSRVDEAQALAEKLTAGETSEQALEESLEKLESDPDVELGAAEISSARKDLQTGGKSFISSIGDAVNRLLDKVTSLGADRRSTLEKDRADQEATRNKARGFIQTLRDRAAGKPPPQPPAQQGQPPQPPPPPPEPLEPEVAKRFETIADLTSGAADFMDQALDKLISAEAVGDNAPSEVLALLEPTATSQASALEELKKALEEAEKLPKEEKEQQQQQNEDGEKKDEEQDGEKQEQDGEKKDGEKDEEGKGEQQKKEEELSREQAEKLLRKFLERDARRAKDRKERDREMRGPTRIGRPDRDW